MIFTMENVKLHNASLQASMIALSIYLYNYAKFLRFYDNKLLRNILEIDSLLAILHIYPLHSYIYVDIDDDTSTGLGIHFKHSRLEYVSLRVSRYRTKRYR